MQNLNCNHMNTAHVTPHFLEDVWMDSRSIHRLCRMVAFSLQGVRIRMFHCT